VADNWSGDNDKSRMWNGVCKRVNKRELDARATEVESGNHHQADQDGGISIAVIPNTRRVFINRQAIK